MLLQALADISVNRTCKTVIERSENIIIALRRKGKISSLFVCPPGRGTPVSGHRSSSSVLSGVGLFQILVKRPLPWQITQSVPGHRGTGGEKGYPSQAFMWGRGYGIKVRSYDRGTPPHPPGQDRGTFWTGQCHHPLSADRTGEKAFTFRFIQLIGTSQVTSSLIEPWLFGLVKFSDVARIPPAAISCSVSAQV